MSKQLTVIALVTLVIVVWSTPARAQLCGGAPSFQGAPIQAGVGVGFTKSTREFGGAVSGGTDTLFVGGTILGQVIDNTTGTGLVVSGRVGSDRVLDADHKVHLCPIGSVSYANGPKFGDFDTSGVGFEAGGQLGVVAAKTSVVDVVPTIGLSYSHARLTATSGSLSVTNSQNYGIATLGVGFIFGSQLALIPSVGVPFGLDNGETQFLIVMSYNFRTR